MTGSVGDDDFGGAWASRGRKPISAAKSRKQTKRDVCISEKIYLYSKVAPRAIRRRLAQPFIVGIQFKILLMDFLKQNNGIVLSQLDSDGFARLSVPDKKLSWHELQGIISPHERSSRGFLKARFI